MASPRSRIRPWAPFLAAAALCAAARAGTAPAGAGEEPGPDEGLARTLAHAAQGLSFSSAADWREALAGALRGGAPDAALEAARALLALPAESPEERLGDLALAAAAVVPRAPRAEAVALLREYASLARRRPGAARRTPAALFATLARGLLSAGPLPLSERAPRAAALADALCAGLPAAERRDAAAALAAAAAAVPRGTPGVEGLALGWLERAQELVPGDPSPTGSWLDLALADALPAPDPASFREAVEAVQPPSPLFRYTIPAWEAAVLAANDDPGHATNLLARARAAWGEARPGEPLPADWFAALSAARDAAGDGDGALEALERGLAEAGRDPTLLNNLAYLLAERDEQIDRALDLVDEALAERPLSPAFLDTLGWILHKRGQFEDAIEAYHKALALLREPDAEIAAHVALAFEALGRDEEAAVWWGSVPVRNAKGPAPGPDGAEAVGEGG